MSDKCMGEVVQLKMERSTHINKDVLLGKLLSCCVLCVLL